MAACERCPFAGNCAACPARRPLTVIEFGKKVKLSAAESIVSTKELFSPDSSGLRPGFFIVNPAGGGSESSASKVICFTCRKLVSSCSCSHSESKTDALKAA